MERFFILDEFNTWYDWDLILTAKNITPPEPKTNYVEIDGMSGTLDLSEALSGGVTYTDRTVSMSFWTDIGTHSDRSKLLRDITAAVHGKKIKIVEPDDPEHYFYGRVAIVETANIIPYMTLSIDAICEPWRYSLADTVKRVEVHDDTPISATIINNGVKTVTPTITVAGSITLLFNDISWEMTTGTWTITDLKFKQGSNVIKVSGDGSVIFTYKEADL